MLEGIATYCGGGGITSAAEVEKPQWPLLLPFVNGGGAGFPCSACTKDGGLLASGCSYIPSIEGPLLLMGAGGGGAQRLLLMLWGSMPNCDACRGEGM